MDNISFFRVVIEPTNIAFLFHAYATAPQRRQLMHKSVIFSIYLNKRIKFILLWVFLAAQIHHVFYKVRQSLYACWVAETADSNRKSTRCLKQNIYILSMNFVFNRNGFCFRLTVVCSTVDREKLM